MAALLASGLTAAYFSYQDNEHSLTEIQREKASSAGTSIRQRIGDIRRLILDVARVQTATGTQSLEVRRSDFERLLYRAQFVSQVRYLDASGRERLRVSQTGLDTQGTGGDYSASRTFLAARSRGTYYGPVTFLGGSRPEMTMAVAEARRARRRRGRRRPRVRRRRDPSGADRQAGYAYAVDAGGQVIAHTANINLVLADTNLAALPQVRAALAAVGRRHGVVDRRTRSQGTEVLSAFETRRPARLAGVRRGAAERGVRTASRRRSGGRRPPGRVPPRGDRDERAARAEPRPADRGDPGRGGEDRLRIARPADRGLQPRRARRPRRRVQPDGRPAGGVLRRARAAGRGADPRAGDGAGGAGREDPRARGRQPPQVGVPRQHVARAADAAERDQRLLPGAAQGAVRRDQRQAGRVPRRHPRLVTPPAVADRRRARPVEGRGRPDRAPGRAVLAAARRSSAGS